MYNPCCLCCIVNSKSPALGDSVPFSSNSIYCFLCWCQSPLAVLNSRFKISSRKNCWVWGPFDKHPSLRQSCFCRQRCSREVDMKWNKVANWNALKTVATAISDRDSTLLCCASCALPGSGAVPRRFHPCAYISTPTVFLVYSDLKSGKRSTIEHRITPDLITAHLPLSPADSNLRTSPIPVEIRFGTHKCHYLDLVRRVKESSNLLLMLFGWPLTNIYILQTSICQSLAHNSWKECCAAETNTDKILYLPFCYFGLDWYPARVTDYPTASGLRVQYFCF